MAISDFLAQVGGALSAQATGGSQGLQSFLGRLAQQQAQQSQQEFERESKLRDQMYQDSRDRKQRAHERGMQAARIAADERARRSDKDEGYEQTARGMILSAKKDLDSRTALESLIRANNPAMPADFVIDFNDTEVIEPLVVGLVKGGGTPRQLAESTEQYQQIVGEQREMFGDAELAIDPTNPNWQADNLKTRQAFNTARSKFTGLQGEAEQLGQELARLQETMPNLSGEQYAAQHLELAQRYAGLVDRLDGLQETSDPRFFSETAYLGQALAPLETQLGTLEAAIGRQPVEKGRDLVAEWELSDPESFPGLTIPGLGGRPDPNNEDVGQVRNFRALLNSGAFRKKDKEFQGQANALIMLTDAQARHLPPEMRDLRARLVEMQAEGTLNLGGLITQLRDKRQAGDTLDAEGISTLISDVGGLNVDRLRQDVGVKVASERAVADARALNSQAAMTAGFGVALFDNDAELQKALSTYGTLDDNGVYVVGDDFLERMIGDDAGLQRIVQRTMESGYAGFDLADQTIERVEGALQRLNLGSPQNNERVRRIVQSMTGQLAALEPDREAELLDGYSSPVADRYLTQVESARPSSSAARTVEEQNEAARAYASSVFGLQVKATDLTRRIQEAAQLASGPGAAIEQDYNTVFGTFELGKNTALRLSAEAEGDTNFSARDLVDLWSRSVPSFRAMLNNPGKVRTQVGPYYAERSTLFAQTVPWMTTDESRGYVIGQDSLSRQYRQSRTEEEVDQNTDNLLGFIDVMRGMEISTLRQEMGSDPTSMAMLTQVQSALRGMSLDQALVTLAGESPSGLSLAQLGFDDAGIAAVTDTGIPTLATLGQVPFDVDAEIRRVDSAMQELERRAIGEWVESRPGEGAVVDQFMLDGRKAELARRRESLEELRDARTVETLGTGANETLSRFLLANDISTPTSLAEAAKAKKPSLTGLEIDEVALSQSGVSQAIDDLGNLETEAEVIDKLFEVISNNDLLLRRSQALPVSQVAPQGLRPLAIKLMEARMNDSKEEVRVIAREMVERERLLGRKLVAADLPPTLAAQLSRTDFDSMESPENEYLPLLRAAKVWAAYNASR